jgi:hypothetical protein
MLYGMDPIYPIDELLIYDNTKNRQNLTGKYLDDVIVLVNRGYCNDKV